MKKYAMVLALTLSAMTIHAEPAMGRVVKLVNGSTMMNLNGLKLQAMLAHRENYNAHSFDILSLMIKDAVIAGGAATWQAVTFFDGDKERYQLTSGGGADCLLHDFRLLKQGKSLIIVQADRELGDSFADKAKVTFSFYELRKNAQHDVGRPLFYFERTRTQEARQTYCDVGDAFSVELKLPERENRER